MNQKRMTGNLMPTSLPAIAKKAREDKAKRFRDLYRMLNSANLRICFYELRKDAAPGVDRVTFEQYEADLDNNLSKLVEKLKNHSYHAKNVRRKYIPKPNGKMRPLGIPTLEDKLLQLAVSKILEAIYEQDFVEHSWGYRPNRSPQKAVGYLRELLQSSNVHYVVEADIEGFFDNISHEWMMKMLEKRIDDRAILRLIMKWLKAGILEETGEIIRPQTGTPQGGIVSPILANIYLHYTLDLWFERVVKKEISRFGKMVRYADDFVCAFETEEQARKFEEQLGKRLEKFNLKVAPDKTRTIPFSRRGPLPSESFDFLGFQYQWVKGYQSGVPVVHTTTSRKKLRASLRTVGEWIKSNRSLPIADYMRTLGQIIRGYTNYYGRIGNSQMLQRYVRIVVYRTYKWLNRRSQKRSYTWKEFFNLLKHHNILQVARIKAHHRDLFSTCNPC